MSTEPVKKTRRQRRNYKTVVDRLVQYCAVSIEVIESLSQGRVPQAADPFSEGLVEAFKRVLAQVESK